MELQSGLAAVREQLPVLLSGSAEQNCSLLSGGMGGDTLNQLHTLLLGSVGVQGQSGEVRVEAKWVLCMQSDSTRGATEMWLRGAEDSYLFPGPILGATVATPAPPGPALTSTILTMCSLQGTMRGDGHRLASKHFHCGSAGPQP